MILGVGYFAFICTIAIQCYSYCYISRGNSVPEYNKIFRDGIRFQLLAGREEGPLCNDLNKAFGLGDVEDDGGAQINARMALLKKGLTDIRSDAEIRSIEIKRLINGLALENAKNRNAIKILENRLGEETAKNRTEILKEVEILVIEKEHLQNRLNEEKIKYQDTIELFEKENATSKVEIFKEVEILIMENKHLQNRLTEENIKYQDSIKNLEKRFAEENAINQESIKNLDSRLGNEIARNDNSTKETERNNIAIKILKEDIKILKEDNKILKEENMQVQSMAKQEKDLLRLHDLIALFRYYFVEPNIRLPGTSNTWGDLSEVMAEAECSFDEGDILMEEFEARRKCWNSFCSVDVDVLNLSSWSKKRNQKAHTEIRSSKKQDEFLRSLSKDTFIDEEAEALRVQLTQHLKTVQLRRKK